MFLLYFLRSLKDVKEQALIALSAAKKLQREQHERDEQVNARIAEQNDVIVKLIAERKQLTARMRDMHRDFLILQQQQPPQPDQGPFYNTT